MKDWHSNLPEDPPIEVLVDTPNCACARDYEELIFYHYAMLCVADHRFPIRERTAPRKPALCHRPRPGGELTGAFRRELGGDHAKALDRLSRQVAPPIIQKIAALSALTT